jgi:hypothetical protein
MTHEPEITIGQGKFQVHVKGNAIKQMDCPLRLLLFGHAVVQFCKGAALIGVSGIGRQEFKIKRLL